MSIESKTGRFNKLLRLAKANGWKTPTVVELDIHGEKTWVNYWMGCDRLKKDPNAGRPIIPHRTGR